jgi:DNA-binding LacI/PurR family transcriptional regulator
MSRDVILGHIDRIAGHRWRGETAADQRAELDGYEAALRRSGVPFDGDLIRAFHSARGRIG